jgi:hypothetical protein
MKLQPTSFKFARVASACLVVAIASSLACGRKADSPAATANLGFPHLSADSLRQEMQRYAPVEIAYDAAILSAPEKAALAKIVAAAHAMDEIFLTQVWDGNAALRQQLVDAAGRSGPQQQLAADLLAFFRLNAGPWIRLEHNRPFIGTRSKPAGAGFYPADLDKAEFEAFVAAHPERKDAFTGYFTRIERAPGGELTAVPYSDAYAASLQAAAGALREAADILTAPASTPLYAAGVDYTTFATFLRSRAAAFLSNDYYQSDMDWMDVEHNILDLTIGPYEVYEDALFNYKASFEAVVGIRNPQDSRDLEQLKSYLPAMERGLPIPDKFKNFERGTDSPVTVIDVVHAAGDIKAGVHAVAYNLPNDERVREAKGSKKVMLKNISRAKYDKILVPIANIVLVPEQQSAVDFDSFFGHTLMHELAHGLGPGTITLADGSKTTVNQVLKTLYSPIEECKADVMGIYNSRYLVEQGVLKPEQLERHYVVFLPGLFRSVRFGLHEAHAKGNLVQYNWFVDQGAIRLDPATDRYTVHFDKMHAAAESLTRELCMLQANGDYAAAEAFVERWGRVPPEVERIVAKLTGIPSDVAPDYDAARFAALPHGAGATRRAAAQP